MFIISFVKDSSVSHILTPRKDGKYFRQSIEEAVDTAADIISASQSYVHLCEKKPDNLLSADSSIPIVVYFLLYKIKKC